MDRHSILLSQLSNTLNYAKSVLLDVMRNTASLVISQSKLHVFCMRQYCTTTVITLPLHSLLLVCCDSASSIKCRTLLESMTLMSSCAQSSALTHANYTLRPATSCNTCLPARNEPRTTATSSMLHCSVLPIRMQQQQQRGFTETTMHVQYR
jgi:hypothetical protein